MEFIILDKALYIDCQLQKNKVGTLEVVLIKTKSSKRTIALVDYTISILYQHLEERRTYKKVLGNNYFHENFVLCNNNDRLYDHDYITRNFGRYINK